MSRNNTWRWGALGTPFALAESLDEINLPIPLGTSQMLRTLQSFAPYYNQAKSDGKINLFLQYATILVLRAQNLIVPTELERLLLPTVPQGGLPSALQEFCKLTEVRLFLQFIDAHTKMCAQPLLVPTKVEDGLPSILQEYRDIIEVCCPRSLMLMLTCMRSANNNNYGERACRKPL